VPGAAAARENVTFSRGRAGGESRLSCCLRCRPRSVSGHAQSDSAKEICRYIEQHLDEPITLERLGKAFRQSPFHLQRRFKAALESPRASTPIPAGCASSSAICNPATM